MPAAAGWPQQIEMHRVGSDSLRALRSLPQEHGLQRRWGEALTFRGCTKAAKPANT